MKNYLIDFVDSASDDVISAYLSNNQCTINHAYKNLNKVYHVKSENVPPMDTSIITSIIDDDESAITLLDIIKAESLPPVDPTRVATIDTPDEKNWWKVYSFADVDLSSTTANIDIYGSDTNIYILDSGIDVTHSEFTGQDINLVYSLTGDFNDTNGHGTGLASLMVGNTCGTTSATVKVVKIFDDNQPTKQSDFLHALDAILNDMNNNINKFSIINCSWAIDKNIYIEDKIRHLINAGGLVVASSGNSGIPIEEVTPASMPEVLTIGGYNSDFVPCDFSNYSNPSVVSLTQAPVNTGMLDGWAPGEQIYVAIPASKGGGYGFASGTSFSAAIYSASLAYNASRHFSDDIFLSHIYSDTGAMLTEVIDAAGRNGLLDLSDPKYNNSVNKLCTFKNTKPKPESSALPRDNQTIYIMAEVNKKDYARIFSPAVVDSYEFITPLPIWITMKPDGRLIGSPTVAPTDPSGLDRNTATIKLYLKDGTTVTNEIYSVVLGNYDVALLPADDPVITYKLQAMVDCTLRKPYPQMMTRPSAWPCATGSQCAAGSFVCSTSTTFAKACLCIYIL